MLHQEKYRVNGRSRLSDSFPVKSHRMTGAQGLRDKAIPLATYDGRQSYSMSDTVSSRYTTGLHREEVGGDGTSMLSSKYPSLIVLSVTKPCIYVPDIVLRLHSSPRNFSRHEKWGDSDLPLTLAVYGVLVCGGWTNGWTLDDLGAGPLPLSCRNCRAT